MRDEPLNENAFISLLVLLATGLLAAAVHAGWLEA